MKPKEYFKECFVFDLKAGFITAIVALPLAIAFALASGVEPITGIYTAIVAGILASSIGGSRFSITGPTAAMTIIILSTVNKYGIEGLLLAGFLAGLIQVSLGLIKIGRLIKYIPLPVVSGFTAGIGIIIFIGQIPNFFGLSIPAKEHVWQTIAEIFRQIGSASFIAVLIAAATLAILVFFPRILAKSRHLKIFPASFFALVLSTSAVFLLGLMIPKVGLIPSALPKFNLISFNLELVRNVLPTAFTVALLGAIESLLCAVVCDGMTNTKHDSNRELVAQGATNMALPFLGGMPATAAIARSAVNVKEGAKTRISGVIHGLFLLIIMLFLAPVAMFIPKAFLAGVLMFVSFRLINFHEVKTIVGISKSETTVFAITLILTVVTDLVFAVQVGMAMAVFLIIYKFSNLTEINHLSDYDPNTEINRIINEDPTLKNNVAIYTMNGPFFFGAMNIFERKLNEHIHSGKKFIILRMKHVPFMDSTAIVRINSFLMERQKKNSKVFLSTLHPGVKKILFKDEDFKRLFSKDSVFETTQDAVNFIKKNYLASDNPSKTI
ncbi:MAG TPA: SulP family inorganic anion transporter [Candidatus Nanoarchaeia archaeon]|nr:SulP family inorganic anion transporter [Candidatus Nanoarchaeia archaeon]